MSFPWGRRGVPDGDAEEDMRQEGVMRGDTLVKLHNWHQQTVFSETREIYTYINLAASSSGNLKKKPHAKKNIKNNQDSFYTTQRNITERFRLVSIGTILRDQTWYSEQDTQTRSKLSHTILKK